jgi:hypothetical protein
VGMMSLIALALLSASPHPELGRVRWLRDFEQAKAESRRRGLPMLVLFDEVPGCSTVRGFGVDVLSHQPTVDRIEKDFVPVAVFNNIGGVDRVILDRFSEPTWNNPVVRIMTADEKELTTRFSGPYDVASFTRLLDTVRLKFQTEQLLVSAHCFWECEARFGQLPAIVSSRAGFLHNEEVVELQFDSAVLSRAALIGEALRLQCANHVFSRSPEEHAVAVKVAGNRALLTTAPFRASEKDTKYYLKASPHRGEQLTELEQLRVNTALRFGSDVERARTSCQLER